jgi:hypothetical protein
MTLYLLGFLAWMLLAAMLSCFSDGPAFAGGGGGFSWGLFITLALLGFLFLALTKTY